MDRRERCAAFLRDLIQVFERNPGVSIVMADYECEGILVDGIEVFYGPVDAASANAFVVQFDADKAKKTQ